MMGEHIECELKLNGSIHRFRVTDIWHWAGDNMTGHRITIYVNHTRK